MRRQSGILIFTVGLALLAPGCFTLDFDGDGMIDVPPPGGYESDYISCSNGRDDDLDGRIDCEDSDCLMRGHCGEQIPLLPPVGHENTFDLCRNGVDDDGDGQFDCGDRECQVILELCCSTEVDDATCSDNIDNDGNGFADCRDFSCRNGPYVTVCEVELSCGDRIDNDGDRFTDCADTDCECTETCRPGCLGPEETLERCGDGFDNDGNGFTDCADFGCSMSTDPDIMALCAGMAEDTEALCADGIDNDNNGFTDCGDRQCYDARSLPPTGARAVECDRIAENTVEKCSDGADNDGNGFTDCSDFSCSRSTDVAVMNHCATAGEANLANCRDGLDNDGNGFTDCADFSCRYATPSPTGACPTGECPASQVCYQNTCYQIESPCSESPLVSIDADATATDVAAVAVALCVDGLDNDGDGFIDCADWECNHNPSAVTPVEGCTLEMCFSSAVRTPECIAAAQAAAPPGGDPVFCEPLCRYAVGRTCVMGPRAGEPCRTDAECAGVAGACVDPGPEGHEFVCPG